MPASPTAFGEDAFTFILTYSGDAVYAPASATGNYNIAGIGASSVSVSASPNPQVRQNATVVFAAFMTSVCICPQMITLTLLLRQHWFPSLGPSIDKTSPGGIARSLNALKRLVPTCFLSKKAVNKA